jgi:hypothetical protein
MAKEMYGGFANLDAGNGFNKWLPSFRIWNAAFDRRRASRVFVGFLL